MSISCGELFEQWPYVQEFVIQWTPAHWDAWALCWAWA